MHFEESAGADLMQTPTEVMRIGDNSLNPRESFNEIYKRCRIELRQEMLGGGPHTLGVCESEFYLSARIVTLPVGLSRLWELFENRLEYFWRQEIIDHNVREWLGISECFSMRVGHGK